MTEEIFERCTMELFGTAEMIDLRGWGESLILPDIQKRIATASAYATIRVVSNLAFRRREVLDQLVDVGAHVVVSIDSVQPSIFAALRGGADIRIVLENLGILVAGYIQRFGSADRIVVATTVQRPALPDLEKIVAVAADHGVLEVRLFGVTAPPSSAFSLDGFGPEVQASLDRMAQIADARGVTLVTGTRLGLLPANGMDVPPCIHPWAYAHIAFDGSVGFCDHLIGPDGRAFFLGSLHQSSFREIWNCPAWTVLRAEHAGRRDHQAPHFYECAWCYRNRFVDFEHYFDAAACDRRIILGGPR